MVHAKNASSIMMPLPVISYSDASFKEGVQEIARKGDIYTGVLMHGLQV